MAGNPGSKTERGHGWTRGINQSSASAGLTGYFFIGLLVAGFGYWAFTAPLGGAVISPGVVAAAGQNVNIQHLEGGIVREINVREGSLVKTGDVLIALDGTGPAVDLKRIEKQVVSLQAKLLRLRAERDGAEKIPNPENPDQSKEFGFREAFGEQDQEFKIRLERYRSELNIMQQRESALEANMDGLAARKTSLVEQLRVVEEETERKKKLLEEGLTNRSEYTALLRTQADLGGKLGELESSIASTRIQKVEAREQIDRVRSRRVEEATAALTETRIKLDDLTEQANAARDVVKRTIIRSPTDGTVVRMQVNSAGSVISPGQPLLEILPSSSELIIEVRVNPKDIDVIRLGQRAMLRLSALNARTTPQFPGVVTYVSADRIIDTKNQTSYFVARLKLDDEPTTTSLKTMVYPGMPVEAFIALNQRTFFEYLFKPIEDSLERAFREE